jgi:hypothetical protein
VEELIDYAWTTAMCRSLLLLPLCLLQTFKTLLVGFPGGKICTEQHVPGYAQSVRQATSNSKAAWRCSEGINRQQYGVLA